jgi:hypothetical protein
MVQLKNFVMDTENLKTWHNNEKGGNIGRSDLPWGREPKEEEEVVWTGKARR